MRRLFIGLAAVIGTVVLPVWALAGNQEVAERIAANLRQSGQLQDYKIGVKYQDGTAWLRGRVADARQLKQVLHVVSRTEGVNRVVNHLAVGVTTEDTTSQMELKTPSGSLAPEQVSRPVRTVRQRDSGAVSHPARRLQEVVDSGVAYHRAEPVASSYVPRPIRQTVATSEAPDLVPVEQMAPRMGNRPMPVAYINGAPGEGGPVPAYAAPMGAGVAPARYDQPHMPNHAWPSYAAYPNYAAVTYPKQYSPTAWPYIGPFYPYPQVPLGWRKVTLEWDDGWWMLDFKD
ncbi:MAG: BON domain-containing protein [Pirellulales bacterium]|nr:BON domain-containing protein [Pirellulales bacterium]